MADRREDATELDSFIMKEKQQYELNSNVNNAEKGVKVVDHDDDVIFKPDDILIQLGGCGLFQMLMAIIIQTMKLVVCWVTAGNSFFAFVPRWRCLEYDMPIANESLYMNGGNYTGSANSSDAYWTERCKIGEARCIKFEYEEGMTTLVPEFDLVCDESWVTATIISVQMFGMMAGSIIVGHIADIFGRKKPFVLSMSILFVFSMVCYFSVNWLMFAVGRFFIGLGSAFFLSIYCIIQGEYTLSKWRSTAISFPSWAIELSMFSLVAYLIPDWKMLTLFIALGSLGFLSTWFFIPESFRWFVVRNQRNAARKVVDRIAKWNKRTITEETFEKMCHAIEKQSKADEGMNHSLMVLFTEKSLLKLTLPMISCWLSLGVIAYGISFGIKKFSGSFFLNLFLFAIASFPSKTVSIYLQVRFGRKPTGIIAYTICTIGGLVVACVQYIDTDYKDSLTTYFALAASAGVDMAWGPIQTLAVEVYPTVARNTAFGFLSTLARFGAVIGPQFVYLEDFIPGILYIIVAVLGATSVGCLMLLPETNNTTLVDNISKDMDKERRAEHTK